MNQKPFLKMVRVLLNEDVLDDLQFFCDDRATYRAVVISRLVTWFAGQDETLQSAVLQPNPFDDNEYPARLILERLAKAKRQ